MKSTDGGSSWALVIAGATSSMACSGDGTKVAVYSAVSGLVTIGF
jgi:hypothetical protein